MKTLSTFSGNSIVLEHDSFFKRNYSLTSNNEVIGVIKFSGAFRVTAEVEMLDQKWEFRYLNMWYTKVGIYQYGYELPFATYKGKMTGSGMVELPKGEVIHLNLRIWKGITEAVTSSGKVLFAAKRKIAWKDKVIFSLFEKNELLDDNPWILMLTAYITVTRRSGVYYY